MQGIEKILLEIADNAQREADKIVGDAQHQASAIVADATASAKAEYDSVVGDAQTQSERIITSANDFSQRDISRKVLEHKSRIINDCFDLALQKLLSLQRDDYFDFVRKSIVKYAEKGTGEVYFNSSDLKRMSPGFELTVNAALPNEKSIKIADTADNSIIGGCKISYGNIDVNLDYSALIADIKPEITGEITELLF